MDATEILSPKRTRSPPNSFGLAGLPLTVTDSSGATRSQIWLSAGWSLPVHTKGILLQHLLVELLGILLLGIATARRDADVAHANADLRLGADTLDQSGHALPAKANVFTVWPVCSSRAFFESTVGPPQEAISGHRAYGNPPSLK